MGSITGTHMHNQASILNLKQRVPLIYGVPRGSILDPRCLWRKLRKFKLIWHWSITYMPMIPSCWLAVQSLILTFVVIALNRMLLIFLKIRLQLNPEQTGLIWFGSAANLSRLQNASLDIHVDEVTVKVGTMGDLTKAILFS